MAADRREYSKAYREANRTRINAYLKEWHAANRVAHNAKMRAYQKARPEEMRRQQAAKYQKRRAELDVRNRAWAKANQDARRAHARAYYHRHKAKVLTTNRKRRQRVEGIVTEAEIAQQRAAQRERCWYCGETGRLVIEHCDPIARGGMNVIGNIVMACNPCNASKGARFSWEWW